MLWHPKASVRKGKGVAGDTRRRAGGREESRDLLEGLHVGGLNSKKKLLDFSNVFESFRASRSDDPATDYVLQSARQGRAWVGWSSPLGGGEDHCPSLMSLDLEDLESP